MRPADARGRARPATARLAHAKRPDHDAWVEDLPRSLSDYLGRRERLAIRDREAIACAVLIPLVPLPGDGDYDVVYTLRSEHLPNHKGQVAFPGGKRSGGEELLETALRESSEEVGIRASDVKVLGCLDDVSTMAGQYVITPWVGLLPPAYVFQANPNEVADIFSVRLSALDDPRYQAHTTKQWGGNDYEISVITAGRHEIWGATHQITRNFLERVGEIRRPPAR